MGNRPFEGETAGKKGTAISMQTSISPLRPAYSFGGLSLVSQTAKYPTCKLESLTVRKGLCFEWKPRQRQKPNVPNDSSSWAHGILETLPKPLDLHHVDDNNNTHFVIFQSSK